MSTSPTQDSPSNVAPFTPIVTVQFAVNTIIVFAVSALISTAALFVLVPKAFPNQWYRLVTLFSPPTSSISTPHSTGSPQRVSLVRARLLFLAALLAVGDAVNFITIYSSALASGNGSFITFHLLRGATWVIACSAYVSAMSMRVAAIASGHPEWKTWFLRIVHVYMFALMLMLQAVLLMTVLQKVDRTPAEWIDATVFPPWTTYPIGVLPILTIGGSVWSLRIAFTHNSTAEASRGDSNVDITGSSGTLDTIESKPAAVSDMRLQPDKSIEYPLTRSFRILSFIVLVAWLVFIFFGFNQRSGLPVRASAPQSVALSVSIFTEGTFEWLLRWNRSRHKKLARRKKGALKGSSASNLCISGSLSGMARASAPSINGSRADGIQTAAAGPEASEVLAG